MLFPPETQYTLASVILYNGAHFKGISLDAKNSHESHLVYDGLYHSLIQIIKMDDPISKNAFGYKIL